MKKINLNQLSMSWNEKQKPRRIGRYAAMLIMLLTLGVGQMWAGHDFFDKGACGVKVNYSGSTVTEIKKDKSGASTEALGTISKLYLKEWWFAAWENSDDFSGSESGTLYYRIYPSGSASGSYSSSSKNYFNWGGWSGGGSQNVWLGNNSLDVNLYSGKDPGNYIMEYYFMMGSSYLSNGSKNYKISFTVPGFTATSKSHTFANTTVSSTKDETISFTQHYGTALTTSNCALTGTNSTEFEVRSITETGVTVRFKPSTAGTKSATLTITDAHSKTCTITLSGTTQYTVTYNKGDYGTGSNVTANKVYGTNLTLRNSGDFSRTGYNHTAWNTNSAGTGGTSYSLGGSYSSEAAVTLYPTWTPKTTSITIDLNGGSAGDESVTATYDSGLPSFTLATKTGGYNLTGYWTDDEDGDKIINSDGTLVRNTSYTSDEATPVWKSTSSSLKLYAQWNNFLSVTYDGNENTGGSAPTDATEYASGDEVTVASAPVGMVKTGYTFAGWNTAPGGGGTSYAAGATFNISANTTLYAQWSENMRTVTISVSPSGAGTLNKTSASVGVATTTTVTATAQPGYRFTGWTATNCSVASTSSASTTLSGDGTTGAATLVANFARTYAYLEGRMTVYNAARSTETNIASTKGAWDESSTRIGMDYDGTNHVFYRHTYKTPAELSAQQNSEYQWFSFKTSTESGTLTSPQAFEPASNQEMSSTGSANKKTVSAASTSKHIRFNSSDASGYALLYFDEAGVWYELEQSLKYNANGGSGDAPTPAYYLKGTNATAASNPFTARAYYTFGGWNTDQYSTGTNYAAGASVPMTANTTLYAKWTRNVTLNQEDATTTGSTSVTGTYNCATLPAITNPEKTGYDFGGWYTEVAGGGNIIINTSGALQADKYHWTDASGRFDRTTTKDGAPLYAKWTQMVTLNANLANHGSGDNTSATIVYKATAKTSITHCTPATGYHLEGYYTAATDGVKVLNADGSFASSAVTDYITDGKWTKAGATTLYAHYEPNTYDVILDVNGATTGSNQTVTATFDAAMPTVCSDGTTPLAAPSKTGYTFGGYWTNTTGTGTQYYTNALASNHVWDVATKNTHIYAKWTANGYIVTLDVDEDNKGTIAGADESASVTFDAAPTTIANRPTATNGYALDGYYTDQLGEGTKVINGDGTWVASVLGYTDADGNWIHDDDVTLYAYYKKAEITELTLAAAIVGTAETDSITVTPTIAPTPTGTTTICWEIQYSNGTALPSQPAGRIVSGNTYRFKAPSASATYQIQATLAKGSSCPADPGDVLSTRTTTFQVAGEHTVTIRYQDSDGRTLQASSSIEARPLTWTTAGDITPPTITGYKFDHWDAGDGVTIKNGESTTTTTTTSSIQIKAVYDGTLTAVYAKKKLIFFNNTLGWSDVYVYFYNSDKYWSGDYGSGAQKGQKFDGDHQPYYEEEHGHMTQIEGTNIWYFDYEAVGYSTRANVVFTEANQHNSQWFWKTKAARRRDHVASLQMFVPLTTKTETKNSTDYFSSGYWMNYPENTGYSLLIYNQTTKAGATKLYEFPFEFTEDFTMPMELVVDLEAGKTYGFEIKRADGTYYSKQSTTLTANTTNLTISKDQSSYCGLQTTAAGDYKFSLYYSSSNYKMDVTYPVAVNDYRIVYTDEATWSKAAHATGWYHPSRVIEKNGSATETKKDTVSFFWSYGSSPAIKYQQCTATGTGSVTWNAGTEINVSVFSSVLTKKGVYNFIFEQPAGGASISLVGVETYTGNYYIRTDCAGSTKWANFSSMDHQMTYSDYAEANSGYSHYYTHWVTSGTNVKFCIANDYSQCITDTLTQDYGTVIANIDAAGALNSASANIRFMWNQSTNKVSRAYIGGSTNISDRFLVLEGDSKMYDKDGSALNISGLNPNEANLIDDQNFVYEREIQVNTKARAKLTAKYNNNIQYFKGSEGAFAEGTTIELLGGDADGKHTMRIVYDFKTNRLVTAYIPSGTIEDNIAINADLMIVREHQEAGQQLLFNGGSLSKVHTVYGVMRFNRWTLNNKEKTGSHDPVGDPKSAYERGLYWISFPFAVNLSDVFGFGTYGTHWIIMEYDGAERAQKGYWKDSDGFWKYVTSRTGKVLEAGKGYVLALDLDLMRDNDATFWSNNIEQVELFFPSAAEVNNISETNVQTTVDAHECTINRHTQAEQDAGTDTDINKNRTKADSHWNLIGVPSYANYGTTLTSDGSATINWGSTPNAKNDLPFLYEWNTVDNTYTVQSGSTYPFKAMHAYMVQYAGELHWSLASATPTSPIVARRTYAEEPQNVEFRLELQQNDKMIDQTFVKLSNDEKTSGNFIFDEDLCKEYNGTKANIYTFIEGYIPAAGNTLPMSEQTTVIPVGVKTVASGDYTFAMPAGTEGVGVTLLDNVTNTRTNLGLTDYTVTLSSGTIDGRFTLEISPIAETPTDIEVVSDQNSAVRKVMIDGILYIVKGNRIYDATGALVK